MKLREVARRSIQGEMCPMNRIYSPIRFEAAPKSATNILLLDLLIYLMQWADMSTLVPLSS